jgi:CheY-like chemotaxis protein
MQLMAVRAQEKQLALRLEVDASVPPMLLGDAMRIEQILLNYLSNAIKFTPGGSVVLRVQQQQAEPDCCVLSFEVLDSGIGLSEEQSARLFQSFEQADMSITRKFGGTGLGLAICKQLAQLMGGTVGVESACGQGSRFWFRATFPLVSAMPAVPAKAEQEALNGALLRGRTFLVVDDSEFNLAVATGLLEDVGARVTTAGNGALALQAMQDQRFDCVLMDVQMPVMDGLEATRRIRADARQAQQLIIALTANASGDNARQCLQAGMQAVLSKPVFPETLYRTLGQWLAPEAAAAWDANALARLVGDNSAAAARLKDKYLLTARTTLAELQQALDAQDWTRAGGLGHKLKSSSRSVGAMHLGALCDALEAQAKAGHGDACPALIAQIFAAFPEVEAHCATQGNR